MYVAYITDVHAPVWLQKVHDALRKFTVEVRNPSLVRPVSVTTHRTKNNTKTIWKQIYANPELFTESVSRSPLC